MQPPFQLREIGPARGLRSRIVRCKARPRGPALALLTATRDQAGTIPAQRRSVTPPSCRRRCAQRPAAVRSFLVVRHGGVHHRVHADQGECTGARWRGTAGIGAHRSHRFDRMRRGRTAGDAASSRRSPDRDAHRDSARRWRGEQPPSPWLWPDTTRYCSAPWATTPQAMHCWRSLSGPGSTSARSRAALTRPRTRSSWSNPVASAP